MIKLYKVWFLMVLFFSSCSISDDDSPTPNCQTEFMDQYVNYTFELDTVGNPWFMYDGFNYLKLRRPDGRQFVLNREKKFEYIGYHLCSFDSANAVSCRIYVTKKAKGASKYIQGRDAAAPFGIEMSLRKNLNGQFNKFDDIKTMKNASDVIGLSIMDGSNGNISLNLNALSNYTKSDIVLYDSTYSNVITVKGSGNISEMYLQENKGIIGFKFATSSPWLITYHY
jgi:hypothetical protein